MIRDQGWNTWDVRRLLAFSFIEGGRERLSVRVSFFDEIEIRRIEEFRWRDLVRVGPHATDGAYAAIEVRAGFEAAFRVEAASDGALLLLSIEPTRISGKRAIVEFIEPGTACARRSGDRIAGGTWCARAAGAVDRDRFFIACEHPYVAGGRGAHLAVACAIGDSPLPPLEEIPDRLARARRAYEATALAGEGELADAPEALARAIAWNTVFDPSGRGIATPVSRNWTIDWKSIVLFGWDTLFVAMMAALEDPELAYRNIEASLWGATEVGFVPNWRLSNGAATLDRSQPPVGGLALARIAATAPDPDRIRAILPGLVRWHAWWDRARRAPGGGPLDGLLAWGSSPEPAFLFPEMRQILRNEAICAAYESGMDNSPLFDGVPFDAAAGTLLAADAGLNAMHAAEAEALAHLASGIGDEATAARLERGREDRCDRIRRALWDPGRRTFANRSAGGAFCPRIAPASLYPLLAGAATAEQAREMVETQLRDPRGFWGEWMLPSIRRDDPAFLDQDYWRGRIWPPMNFLAAAGLRRYGFGAEAAAIAESGLRMFLRAWRDESRVYENWSALTGEGGNVPNADPLYAWGALLAYIAIQEIFDIDAAGTFSFGSARGFDAGIRSVRIRGEAWRIRSSPDGLLVARGSDPVIESDRPCRIEGLALGADPGTIRIDAPLGGRIRIHDLRAGVEVRAVCGDRRLAACADPRGTAEIEM
ncbi:MAG: hypothetical protein JXP34_05635 [Planctomycetes bacterium]|nr:hypothetical protein [Planctomycetota bacterium]